jgi:adenosylcobinamide-GDP ribazoletransferase
MVLLLLGKWVLLQVALPVWLVAPPVVGRWAMVLAAYSFPHARSAGLGVYFRKGLGQQQMIVASLITGVVMVLMGWWFNARLLLLLFVPLVTIFLLGRWAANRLGGGLTGDVYGAMGEVTELACLAALIMV